MSGFKLEISEYCKSLKEIKIKCVQYDKPEDLGPEEVLIKVLFSPVNATDLFCIRGSYFVFHPNKFPAVPGLECVGIVENVGENVTSVKSGQRVIPLISPDLINEGLGAWQEFIKINEERLIVVPEGVTDETAAQFITNHLTPYAMFKSLKIPKEEFLVQNAANGTTGRQILKISKHFGIKIINIVHQSSHVEELKKCGAEYVLCADGETNVLREVVKITQAKCAYAAVDAIGGEHGILMSNLVAESRAVTLYGLMGGLELKAFAHSILFRDVTYKSFWIIRYLKKTPLQIIKSDCQEMLELIRLKVVDSLPGCPYPFSKINEALEAAQRPNIKGKVLLSPDGTLINQLTESLDKNLSLSIESEDKSTTKENTESQLAK